MQRYAMRSAGLGAAVVAAMVWAGSATAQSGPFTVSARAGIALPAGDLHKIQDPGFHAGGALAFYFSKHVALRGEFSADFLNSMTDSDGEVPSPAMTLLHFNGGFEFNFTRPKWQDHPLTFLMAIGVGATSGTAKETYDDGTSVDWSQTMLTGNASAEVGWQFNESVNVYLAGYAYLMKFGKKNTEVFADRSTDVEPFEIGWTFPVTVGVRLSLQ